MRIHLSNSIIKLWQCKYRWQQIMVSGIEEPTSDAAMSGLILHMAYAKYIEHLLRMHLKGRTLQTDWDWFRKYINTHYQDADQHTLDAGQHFVDWFEFVSDAEHFIEKKLALDWDFNPIEYPDEDADAHVHCRVDYYRIRGDLLEVYDWKTGLDSHTTAREDANKQLELYAWIIAKHNPQIKRVIISTFFTAMYKTPLEPIVCDIDELNERIPKWLIGIRDEMAIAVEQCKAHDLPQKSNPCCKWCGFSATCPWHSRKRYKYDPNDPYPDEEPHVTLERLQAFKQAVSGMEKMLKATMKRRIEDGYTDEIAAGGLYLGERIGKQTEGYDPRPTSEYSLNYIDVTNYGEVLELVYSLMCEISPAKLRDWVKLNPQLESDCIESAGMLYPEQPKASIGIWANPPDAGETDD